MRKNRFNIYIIGVLAVLLKLSSCDPVEDREVLKNAYHPDDIELNVVHDSPGSNSFTLEMNTPGVIGYWDYIISTSHSDRVKVDFPFIGTQTFHFIVSSGYLHDGDIHNVEYIKKSIEVDIEEISDPESLPKEWFYLAGEESKTWVFDRSDPDAWWYMTGEDPEAFWWQPDYPDGAPSDVYGRMVFDLLGGPNYTYYEGPDADPVEGSTFEFNSDFSTLTIVGDANILGVEDGGVQNEGLKEYEILELTEDRMVLFISDVDWSPGWVWVFKPEE
ncbi:hypothetical protein QA597_10335 [Marinilabiliaceae bacterium ANBcel2]|nr:hypothetical protein [Marinilabiliaceae bacterium ANBcel2]